MRRYAAALAGSIVLVAMSAGVAHADPVIAEGTVMTDDERGAVRVTVLHRTSDGAVYVKLKIVDNVDERPQQCAAALVRWYHVNGRTYRDGWWTFCGTAYTRKVTTPVRDPNRYRRVQVEVWTNSRNINGEFFPVKRAGIGSG